MLLSLIKYTKKKSLSEEGKQELAEINNIILMDSVIKEHVEDSSKRIQTQLKAVEIIKITIDDFLRMKYQDELEELPRPFGPKLKRNMNFLLDKENEEVTEVN